MSLGCLAVISDIFEPFPRYCHLRFPVLQTSNLQECYQPTVPLTLLVKLVVQQVLPALRASDTQRLPLPFV
jgi:hypothetical protein